MGSAEPDGPDPPHVSVGELGDGSGEGQPSPHLRHDAGGYDEPPDDIEMELCPV